MQGMSALKKIAYILLAFALVASMLLVAPINAFANDAPVSGSDSASTKSTTQQSLEKDLAAEHSDALSAKDAAKLNQTESFERLNNLESSDETAVVEEVTEEVTEEDQSLPGALSLEPLDVTLPVNDRAELDAVLATITDNTTISLSALFVDTSGTSITLNTNFNITIDGTAATALGASSFNITQSGAGIITLKNLTFASGTATALNLNGSTGAYKLDGCSFTGLTATALIINSAVAVDITNCTFKNNYGNPGALTAYGVVKTSITTSSFIGNHNSTTGGGAMNMVYTSGEFSIDRCYFYQNYSDSPAAQDMQGGAIRFTNCGMDVVIKDSLFVENNRDANSATNCDGGALSFRNNGNVGTATISITGTTFEGNSTGDDGGAMLLESNLGATNLKAYVANCTFTNNYAGGSYTNNQGGGIAFYGMVNSEITHCTFYKNRAKGGTKLVASPLFIGPMGGGAVALDTGATAPSPDAPILSNNIFIANTCDTSSANSMANVYIYQNALRSATENNGNVGYDNGEYPGYSAGQNVAANITVENVFAQTTGSGIAAVPTRTYFGAAVGATGNTAQRFCYIPSPLTDEMYRDGSGPYYDANVRSDVRGYPRDHFPNAGAVEIYWTKFDPNVAIGGTWVSGAVPPEAIRSLLTPDIFYLVTNPSPDNQIITFPRASIDIANPASYSFQYWESNQPSNPADPPASFVYPHVDPATAQGSSKQTYTAIWTQNPVNFRVDFNLQYDVSGVPQFLAHQTVAVGGTATKPAPDPTRTGYVLDSWYKEPGCTTLWSFGADTITADTTLYAKWSLPPAPQTFTVRFVDWNGALLKSEPVSGGGSASPPANPYRGGYTFTGWSGNYTNVWADTTVTAQYSYNGGGTVVTPDPDPGSGPGSDPDPDPAPDPDPDPDLELTPTPATTPPPTVIADTPEPLSAEEEAFARQENESLFEALINGDVPLAGPFFTGAWSLLSLILAVLGILLGLVQLLRKLLTHRQQDNGESAHQDEQSKSEPGYCWIFLSCLGLLPMILFLILDDISLPVVWINSNTVFVALALLVELVLMVTSSLLHKKTAEPS